MSKAQLHIYESKINTDILNDQLLMRYISGNVSENEKIQVVDWLEADPANMKEFMALRKLHDIALWRLDSIKEESNKSKWEKIKLTPRKFAVELLKVAAVFVVTFGAVHYLFPLKKESALVGMHTVSVPAGQHAELTLADGTKVWLNTKTTLTFPEHFSSEKREVKLDGEGFFEVVKNNGQPFIVQTTKYNVRVLGTEFNVSAYSSGTTFETSLFEGSVEILKPNSETGLLIKPKQRAFLENNQLITGPIVNYKQFMWKEGLIIFNNESFPEIIRKLELYFDLDITVKNKLIQDYSCTGKFRTTDGIEHILKVLQLNNNFQYQYNEVQKAITIE